MKKVWMLSALSLALASGAQAAKLTAWVSFTEASEIEFLKRAATEYGKATGDSVEIVSVPFSDLKNKAIVSSPAGKGPDLIIGVPHDWLGELVESGVAEPLTSRVRRADVKDLQPVAVDAFTYKGRLFGLPLAAESLALIYNKKLVSKPPATWNEFLKVAQGLTDPAKRKYGFVYPLEIPYYNYAWLSGYGGYVFKQGSNGYNISDLGLAKPAAVKAAQLVADLRYKYNLIPLGIDYAAANSAFTQGAAAMTLNGPWALADYRKAGLDYGIASIPTPPGGTKASGPFVGVQGVTINPYSSAKAQAVKFAQSLTSPDQQVRFSLANGRIPVSKTALANPQVSKNSDVVSFSKVIAQGTPMPNVPQMSSVWEPWGKALAVIVREPNQNVARNMDIAVKEIRERLKK